MAASRAKLRSDDRRDFWTAKASPLSYGREEFRFRLIRSERRLPAQNIDPWVTDCSWGREDAKLAGQLTFRRPLADRAATMLVKDDEVELQRRIGEASWKPQWRLRVAVPDHQVGGGTMTVALSSPTLDALFKTKVAWKFRKDRRHPKGWTAKQITEHVARRLGVPLVSVPGASHRIVKLVRKEASGADIINAAWKAERQATGRRFDADTSTGRLEVREIAAPRYKLLVSGSMLDATVRQSLGSLATVIVATATVKAKGSRRARKLRVTVVNQARRRRYGYIVKTVKAPAGIDSAAGLRRWAKAELARTARPKDTITFTHPGLPDLDRGDVIGLKIPDADFDQLVFVTAVQHTVGPASYTMEVTVSFTDPYVDARAERVKKKKAIAAARRRNGSAKVAAPKPKRATLRT